MKYFPAFALIALCAVTANVAAAPLNSGPLSIKDSNVGDIINIEINVNCALASHQHQADDKDLDVVGVIVGLLKQIGDYELTEQQVRDELSKYKAGRDTSIDPVVVTN
jgi:hypothetical protein